MSRWSPKLARLESEYDDARDRLERLEGVGATFSELLSDSRFDTLDDDEWRNLLKGAHHALQYRLGDLDEEVEQARRAWEQEAILLRVTEEV